MLFRSWGMGTVNLASKCPCCGSKNFEKRLGFFQPFISHKVMDYPIDQIIIQGSAPFFPLLFTNSLRCLSCSFVFSQARFDDDEMGRIYSGYRDEAYADLRNRFEPGYKELNQHIGKHPQEVSSRADALFDFMSTRVNPEHVNSVLDYGGDKGQHIPEYFCNAKKYVYEVSGIEAIEGVTKVNDSSIGCVDFIMCSNVLEHLPYPSKTLNNIKEWMDKETMLFVDVPDEITGAAEHPISFHEHIKIGRAHV